MALSTNNVTVDCAGHTINGYVKFADGVSNVVVRNCVMNGTVNPNSISNVTISNSIMSNIVVVRNGHDVIIDHNHISLSTCGRPGGMVNFANGGGNQIIGNTIDGCYAGNDVTGQGIDAPGADDGVILTNEAGDTVRDNTIENVFDAGIEGVDTVTGTTISNNTVSHAIVAGIASYWCTDWENNTISGNRVSGSMSAVAFSYDVGLCGDPPWPAGRFVGNTISDNSLRNPLQPRPGFLIYFSLAIDPVTVTTNTVDGNDVGTKAMVLAPSEGFSVGSGNVCGPAGTITC